MALYPDYVTAADLKAFVRVTDTGDDTQLALAVTAASRAVDYTTSRQFGQNGSAVARQYTAYWSRALGMWCVDIDDLQTASGLVVKSDQNDDGTYEVTHSASDFRTWPYNAVSDGLAWTRIVFRTSAQSPAFSPGGVEVTANWGWTAVPSTVKNATLIQATRFYKRRDAPFGIAGSPNLGGDPMRLLAKVDPDVAIMLLPYTRPAYL